MNAMLRYPLAATVVLAAIAASCAVSDLAEAAKFLGLGDLPGGTFQSTASAVSANGSLVVGLSNSTSGGEAFRWTAASGMAGLGDLPGGVFASNAVGVSADGSVVVGFGNNASSSLEAFRWTSGGGMVALGDLAGGGFQSNATGVSADGAVVVGSGVSASGFEGFRWTAGTGMAGVGDLAGGLFFSSASGVSADGSVVVGLGNTAAGQEAFRWTSSGGMIGLGDLPGGATTSAANRVSADGVVVVGQSNSASGQEAFRWTSDGGMVGLGDFAGGGFASNAFSVSANGSMVVGQATTSLGAEAFLWDADNGMRRVRDVLSPSVGAELNGWILTAAQAVSADGRTIVGFGTDPGNNTQAWLAYLGDTVNWYPQASGAWDSGSNWTGPFLPGATDDVVIDPTTAVTITGPIVTRTVNSMSIGGSGVGRVTLRMAGASNGDLQASSYAILYPNAELSLADGRVLYTPSLYNYGVVRGAGTVNANLTNYAGAELRVASGETMVVSGSGNTNDGKFEVIGGALEFLGVVANNVGTGLVTGRNATLRFQAGLTNAGSLSFSGGVNDVSGDVDNTGTIVVSGGAATTFYDDVIQNGVMRVSRVGSTTSTAVFLGDFTGSGGSEGGGDIFFEGDLRPGNSPAIVTFDNNVGFGSGTITTIELAGVMPGTEYDRIRITGALTLNGVLNVTLLGSYVPAPGDSFDILDWGNLSGTFASLSLPALAGGMTWNTSQLYATGVLSVVAPGLLGDYNEDGLVDAADYTRWRDNLGSPTSLPNDDTPGVAADDYTRWVNNYGSATAPSSTHSQSIPEPATSLLAFLATTAVGRRRCI
jgi:probable HAF family extracellular repeat protein